MKNLEPAPLNLDVRDLVGHPGSMRELCEDVPTPADFGAGLMTIPEGSPLNLDLRLESVHEGILVSGTAQAEAEAECGRCLEAFTDSVQLPVQELYLYDSDASVSDQDDEERLISQDHIDLEPMLRDAFVGSLPFQPVCDPDCPGLCDQCGIRLAEAPQHHHEMLDPRWAALSELTGLGKPESPENNTRS